jgi:transcriptional regulator with XRE-family HTH domain
MNEKISWTRWWSDRLHLQTKDAREIRHWKLIKNMEDEMKKFLVTRNETGRLRVDGSAVRHARNAAGLTQNDVASRMSVLGYFLPQPYVSMVEHGKYPWGFTDRKATALAAALGVGVGEITGVRLTLADAQHIQQLVSQLGEVVGPEEAPATRGQAAQQIP